MVLVIIAILAAIAIPAMTGWIDKANEKAVLAEARAALIAAQTLLAEDAASTSPTVSAIDVEVLASLGSGTVSGLAGDSSGVITGITYNDGKYTAVYDDESWDISKN